MAKKKKVLVVRDIQRFTRNWLDVGILYKNTPSLEESLWASDIPILSINEAIVVGTNQTPQPASDLVAPILIAAGGAEISTRKKQTLQGLDRALEKGIKGGQPLDLSSKSSQLNLFRETKRLVEAGVGQTQASRMLGKSSSFFRKTRDKLATMTEAQQEEWLGVIDMVRAMEQQYGLGVGKNAIRRMMAVRRVASGFLKQPLQFDAPTKESLEYAYKNYNEFKPPRGW